VDSTQPGSPSSIAAVGFALSCYPVAVERGWMPHELALSHSLMAARFFDNADQSGAADGVGYKGFFYHFLHADTGKRAWQSELSTIDTALLIAGLLIAAQYFDGEAPEERELRKRAQEIYARVDWRWAQNGEPSITMGWNPESGFLPWRWLGYNEALLLYVLALAAPQLPGLHVEDERTEADFHSTPRDKIADPGLLWATLTTVARRGLGKFLEISWDSLSQCGYARHPCGHYEHRWRPPTCFSPL